MKTVTFFNEKGGSGKTTFNVLFASWLAYERKEKVYAIDLDSPNYRFAKQRDLDHLYLKNGIDAYVKLCRGNEFYPIIKDDGGVVNADNSKREYTFADLQKTEQIIRQLRNSRKDGYIVLDFPGSFSKKEPFYHLVSKGLIDLIVIPIDSDGQCCDAALNVWIEITKKSFIEKYALLKAPNCVMLWNKETRKERTNNTIDYYARMTEKLEDLNVDVIAQRVHDIDILKRSYTDDMTHAKGFLRNTLCFPTATAKLTCPYLDGIFTELKDRLDGKIINSK